MTSLLGLCLIGILIGSANARDAHKVHCTEELMTVEISLPLGTEIQPGINVYLEGLKGYPDVRCQPTIINGTLGQFKLSLTNFYECGVTRMVNNLTGKKVYYHKVIIEQEKSKEMVNAKCITSGPFYEIIPNNPNQPHAISKRDTLPVGFQEPEDLEITKSYTEYAPEPILAAGVRQGGELVTGELNVSPGTPLTMEIYLDKNSSSIYGLAVTYMQVTDTRVQEETIIFNGCSVDPYLFENFNTVDGDYLSAKFRAFKFPESTYVQFRATVNVCLDKCQGTPCSNGQFGYGRRRREINHTTDPNKVYEISMATFIKVSGEGINKNEVMEIEERLRQLKIANQKLARNSRGSVFETVRTVEELPKDSAAIVEETTLIKLQGISAASSLNFGQLFSIAPLVAVLSRLLL